MERPPSKDSLLRQADGLRDLARRSRKLASTMVGGSDRSRLERHALELDDSASRAEREAIEAKAG